VQIAKEMAVVACLAAQSEYREKSKLGEAVNGKAFGGGGGRYDGNSRHQ
jgi:hypothetical protein